MTNKWGFFGTLDKIELLGTFSTHVVYASVSFLMVFNTKVHADCDCGVSRESL